MPVVTKMLFTAAFHKTAISFIKIRHTEQERPSGHGLMGFFVLPISPPNVSSTIHCLIVKLVSSRELKRFPRRSAFFLVVAVANTEPKLRAWGSQTINNLQGLCTSALRGEGPKEATHPTLDNLGSEMQRSYLRYLLNTNQSLGFIDHAGNSFRGGNLW